MNDIFTGSLLKTTLVWVGLLASTLVSAAPLPEPTGKVLLKITGNIENFNTENSAEIDLALLETLPVSSFTTDSLWIKEPKKITGVRSITGICRR